MAKIIKPPALRPGDTVGVVALAAAVDSAGLERGVVAISDLGYRVKLSPHVLNRAGVFAGEDKLRAGEFTAFFRDPEVKGVFGARGGYGSGRLLPLLDFAELARTPKIFVGFSDATFVLNALVDHSHMVSFHGPMVATDLARGLNPRALAHLQALLSDTRGFELDATEALRPGIAEGPLIGGCLSVIVAMMATPWQPVFDGRILFLEDTGEKAYRIDRMLVQLRQAGVFERVAGIIFGAMRPVAESAQEQALIAEFVGEHTAGLKCPVLFGIEAGHGSENLTLPMGIRVRLDSRLRRMAVMEAAVS
ncbi:MAG: LD-carboxypeptidase [Deltaproteobacteria bacterium]|nr:LD-carboxypeptidase [Deltaproteobacteria bacterium]